MAHLEKRDGLGEEEKSLLTEEELTLLDIDMLCSAVVMQANEGSWGKFNRECDEENRGSADHLYGGGGGVFRMWEGGVVDDCCDDPRIALQSACCPCYRFGKNMKRAGLGSCLFQGSVLSVLTLIALFNLFAFVITSRQWFLYLAVSFTISIATYLGYYRVQIRKKFNIKDDESSLDDCVYHLICPCCTLCQESRTLEMNNVQDGIWHGRGDTICIGSLSEDVKPPLELNQHPFVVSTKSPQFSTIQKNSGHGICST